MVGIDFFTTWQLWQQMTFVLACAIVLVFFAGLGKLWWINRSVRKHELLDEEKKERMTEIRKTGIPVKKRPEIPFGVRAIQSGIEVDGIWISRPGTPNSQTPLGASLLSLSGAEGKGKAKINYDVVTTSPQHSPSSSIFETSISPPKSPATGPQSTYRPKHVPRQSSARANEALNADALSKPDGTTIPKPALQTYIPRSSFAIMPSSSQSSTSERTSSSSDEAYVPLRQPSAHIHARKNSSFPELMDTEREGYFSTPKTSPTGSPENPFATPEGGRTRQASVASSFRLPTGVQTPAMAPPARSYSGETHVNRASRRVNAGFEVLPAGTFGAELSANGSEVDLESGDTSKVQSRSRSVMDRLHKKTTNR
ncbi:hypothetical protein BKA67DRAFT_541424 [Truncatella angustata]|uniref:Uncharacterized protein n=1 Tax=Truncatella angustata TaxID=152316 RepID=A0A9P8RI49_9PEZI|nr:uncharacterized protein BKA67DRAFT_541424 [Truncatella angustata]KAH6646458.1 hypothetical protein BKA67DRAFT_541424 [Truncatella angustata]